MKVCTIVGARPQFIKTAPVSQVLQEEGHTEILVHTGQHYDFNMSEIFFRQLHIRLPDHNLGVTASLHGAQTGEMLIKIEQVLLAEKPDLTLTYGDTNSTLAGALASAKLHIPLAHIEAGERSYNRQMPEEHNRVLTDHASDLLFCATQAAVQKLAAEGITQGVTYVGDVMYDAWLQFSPLAGNLATLQTLGVSPQSYYLATIHRPANTDVEQNLAGILDAFAQLAHPVILPAHPRTRKQLDQFGIVPLSNIRIIEPVGYLEMLALVKNARTVLTDSGGVQREAYFSAVPCVTIRREAEFMDTVTSGWNTLAEPRPDSIRAALAKPRPTEPQPPIFGDGHAARRVVDTLTRRHQFRTLTQT
jgi:UDP-GlcNAc3NAcA epimerase